MASPRQRDQARLLAQIDEAQRWLKEVRAVLPELLRRVEEPAGPDGYPTGSGEPVATSDISDSTASCALTLVEGRIPADLISDWVERLVENLDVTHQRMRTSKGLVVLLTKDTGPGRRSVLTDCINCGEPALPRARSGRCLPCYDYRRRHGWDKDRPLDDSA